jgi:hypothetical protein
MTPVDLPGQSIQLPLLGSKCVLYVFDATMLVQAAMEASPQTLLRLVPKGPCI